MRSAIQTIVFLIVFSTLYVGCAASTASYPSYEAVVAQYIPAHGIYEGQPLNDNSPSCTSMRCSCPRLWYRNHWVYYCDNHWIYRHYSAWYYYPHFYVRYQNGVPHTSTGPIRHITKGPAPVSSSVLPKPLFSGNRLVKKNNDKRKIRSDKLGPSRKRTRTSKHRYFPKKRARK